MELKTKWCAPPAHYNGTYVCLLSYTHFNKILIICCILVTLQALHGYFIGGFFIQARRAGSCNSKEQRQPLGVFQLVPGETYLRTMSCNNRLNVSYFQYVRVVCPCIKHVR